MSKLHLTQSCWTQSRLPCCLCIFWTRQLTNRHCLVPYILLSMKLLCRISTVKTTTCNDNKAQHYYKTNQIQKIKMSIERLIRLHVLGRVRVALQTCKDTCSISWFTTFYFNKQCQTSTSREMYSMLSSFLVLISPF